MATEDKNGCLHDDIDGKFLPKDKNERKAYDNKDNFKQLINKVETGDKSGALNPNSEEAIEHGKLMY